MPFHSPLRGIGLANAWHNDDECPVARSIAPADRRPGIQFPSERCPYCTLLDAPTATATRKRRCAS